MKIHIFEVKNELIFKKFNFCDEKIITRNAFGLKVDIFESSVK